MSEGWGPRKLSRRSFLLSLGAVTVAEIKVTAQGKFVPRPIPAFITSPGHPVLQG